MLWKWVEHLQNLLHLPSRETLPSQQGGQELLVLAVVEGKHRIESVRRKVSLNYRPYFDLIDGFTSMWDILSACSQLWASPRRCLYPPAALWPSAAWGSTVWHQGPDTTKAKRHEQGMRTSCVQWLTPKCWSHQARDGVVKILSIFSNCLSNIRVPTLLQCLLAASDEMFEVNVSDELVGLVHHSLRDTKTDSSVLVQNNSTWVMLPSPLSLQILKQTLRDYFQRTFCTSWHHDSLGKYAFTPRIKKKNCLFSVLK